MHVLTVSAHYPPNFTSGGTLAPQRLAQGLAGRGHRSSVYAGWLGERPPLEAWDEVDEAGVAVHWVATSPWIGWDDEHNWHNPAVTDEFRAHLERIGPDVVHFHSLQSLGAGLLPVAKASGAAVVVTMHDFWWLCARQFLVDTEMHPCSLVVEAGVCPCQVDQGWRRHRGASLEALLASADLVLAPSASAVRVLAANGVAPGRLQVDENGLPDELLAPPARSAPPVPGAPVRFLYAGGADPLKGADVLVDAVSRLGRRVEPDRWRLTAYGLGPRLADSTAATPAWANLPVTVADAYDPDQLGSVLADHDVLVLPSIMRETHSLLTREALGAGLAVVCTDTLGPEEVVVDGGNGLVVPAADPEALAEVLVRLVEHRQLLIELRQGADAPVVARTLDDQLTGLEAHYAHLVAPAPETCAPDPLTRSTPAPISGSAGRGGRDGRVRRVVFATGIDGAPLRYRAWLPAEALAGLGVASTVLHYRHPALLATALEADVVVLYRVPATPSVLELIEACHGAGQAVAFDVDDLIFDPSIAEEIPALRLLPPDEGALWLQGVERYRTTLEACDAFIGSTDLLVERATALTGLPAHRFDNGVGFELARAADAALRRPRRPGPPRLGYLSGTTTHDDDWRFVAPAVVEVLDRHPEAELWLGGHLPDDPTLARFGARVVRTEFRPWLELPDTLRDLDVNLAPLEPAAFNQAKSAIKWLEAALCATPTVASPTGPFAQAIGDGVDGRLADTPEAWVEALDDLLGDPAARARLGTAARRRALLDWSPARQGPRYAAILDQVATAGPRRDRASAWVPVVLDEPAAAIELEAYGDPAVDGFGPAAGSFGSLGSFGSFGSLGSAGGAGPDDVWQRVARSGRRVEDVGRRGWASLRRDGLAPTAHKGLDKVRARLGR